MLWNKQKKVCSSILTGIRSAGFVHARLQHDQSSWQKGKRPRHGTSHASGLSTSMSDEDSLSERSSSRPENPNQVRSRHKGSEELHGLL